MDNLEQLQERLTNRLKYDSNILFALIFGSYAKCSQHTASDLDIAIFFKQPLSGLDLLNLIHELSEYTKKEVDIVVLNYASAFLRHQVIKHCIRLFIRDMAIYRNFREQTMTDYDIYKFISGMNKYDR